MKTIDYNPANYDLGIHTKDLSIITTGGDEQISLIDNVSVDIGQGEHVAIHGASGAGKSLFATALCGIRFNENRNRFQRSKPGVRYLGAVSYDLSHRQSGETTHLSSQENILRRNIGFVPQELILDNKMTAEDNIFVPLALKGIPANPELLLEACYRLGIGNLLSKQAGLLSGGQKQRVAIARAFASGPNAVILDEPTAALNQDLKDETSAMLDAIVQDLGVTVVSVTHESSLASRRIEMEDGRIISDTTQSSATEKVSDFSPQA